MAEPRDRRAGKSQVQSGSGAGGIAKMTKFLNAPEIPDNAIRREDADAAGTTIMLMIEVVRLEYGWTKEQIALPLGIAVGAYLSEHKNTLSWMSKALADT